MSYIGGFHNVYEKTFDLSGDQIDASASTPKNSQSSDGTKALDAGKGEGIPGMIGKLVFCCGQAAPKAVAGRIPLKVGGGVGGANLRWPTLWELLSRREFL